MAEASIEMVAKRAGECVIITSFECNEMGDIQGHISVTVNKKKIIYL